MIVKSDPEQFDNQQWFDFVMEHPNGSIFHTPEMYIAYRETPNYEPLFLVCRDNNNKIQGLLLAVIHKEYKGVLGLFSSRSIIFGGPLLLNNNLVVLNSLLLKYNKIVRQKAIYTQFRNFYDQNFYKEIFKNNKFIFEEHLNILLDLSIGKKALFENFSKSRKKGIRKAMHENFNFEVIDRIEFIEDFYNLLTISYNKIKLPIPQKKHFYELHKNLKADNFKMFSLKLNGELVVTLFALLYKETLYGYYMGSDNNPETLKMKPTDLFFWDVFNWAIDNNIRYFDWMGAGKPDQHYGVRDFKQQFGGELVNFGRYIKIHKPFMYRFGKKALKIWQKLK